MFRAMNSLPDWLYVGVWPFMQYGVFVTIPIASLVAFLLGRRHLAGLLATGGVAIYVLARVVKLVTDRGRPMVFLPDVNEREQFAVESLGYTSGHAAVAATIATLTVFHLPPRLQRLSVALVAIVGLGRIYVGAHLPLDVIGGAAMGVAAGCIVTYLFARRHGAPSG